MPLKNDKKELRKFGYVMAGAFALLASLLLWKNDFASWSTYPVIFGSLSALFLTIGLLIPMLLSPIEWAWMKLAHVMGFVMTRVILTVTYVLIIVPTGLIFKLMGKDLLDRKLNKNAESYWISAESDGPWTRPDKPY